MNRRPPPASFHPPSDAAGLTFLEVLIALAVLVISGISSLQLFGQFTSRIAQARDRDSLSVIVARDLATIRRRVDAWCDVRASPCSGPMPIGEGQRAYNPDPAECDRGTLAVAMMTQQGLPDSANVVSGADDPARVADVVLTRQIEARGNELKVSYAMRSGSELQVQTSTTLVPPALGWCP